MNKKSRSKAGDGSEDPERQGDDRRWKEMDRRTRREVDKIGLVICRCGGRHRRNRLGLLSLPLKQRT